jgi:hypothetical protein
MKIEFKNLNLPGLLAYARAFGEQNPNAKHWTAPVPDVL